MGTQLTRITARISAKNLGKNYSPEAAHVGAAVVEWAQVENGVISRGTKAGGARRGQQRIK